MSMRASLAPAGAALLLACATAAAAAPPPASGHPSRACISPEFIDGISAPNTRTAYISVGPSDMFKIDMMGPCMDLDWPETPKKLINKNGSGDICDGRDMVIVVGRGERCYVSSMHKMSPAEIAAWRKGKP